MEFEYTPAQKEFRQDLRSWLEDHLPDGWIDGDRPNMDELKQREEFLRDWQRTLYEDNWAGIHWPEEYGGQDATLWEQAIYSEEMAQVNAPPRINGLGIGLVGPTLMEVGTDEQKERFLPNILSAEEIWCQGYSEPGSGSDLASLQCQAEEQGDVFVINGEKIWTSWAHVADWCFLLARTDDSGDKHHGITAFLLDMDQAGVSTELIRQINDDDHFNQVFFDDAVVKKEHVVGEIDDGWNTAMTLSRYEQTTSRIFSAERRFEELVEYCKTTVEDGEKLIEHPEIAHRLAEFKTKIQAAKITYFRNITKRSDTGRPAAEGLMDNVYTNEIIKEMEDFRLEVLGPNSALWNDGPFDGEWTFEYLRGFAITIAGGTKDIKRNLIGERALGLPKGFRSN